MLTKNDGPKVTQMRLELTVSWYLTLCLNHYIIVLMRVYIRGVKLVDHGLDVSHTDHAYPSSVKAENIVIHHLTSTWFDTHDLYQGAH